MRRFTGRDRGQMLAILVSRLRITDNARERERLRQSIKNLSWDEAGAMANVFSLTDYIQNPTYPAAVEFWLTKTAPVNPLVTDLAAFAEATFQGYQRVTGTKAQLFSSPDLQEGAMTVQTKGLNFIWTGGGAEAIKGILAVASWPDGSFTLIRFVSCDVVIGAQNPGITGVICFAAVLVTA